jgi:predicted MFS family arabinose efflux permease
MNSAGNLAARVVRPTTHSRTIVVLSLAAFASAASMRACDSLLAALVATFGISTGQAAHTISFFALAYGLT